MHKYIMLLVLFFSSVNFCSEKVESKKVWAVGFAESIQNECFVGKMGLCNEFITLWPQEHYNVDRDKTTRIEDKDKEPIYIHFSQCSRQLKKKEISSILRIESYVQGQPQTPLFFQVTNQEVLKELLTKQYKEKFRQPGAGVLVGSFLGSQSFVDNSCSMQEAIEGSKELPQENRASQENDIILKALEQLLDEEQKSEEKENLVEKEPAANTIRKSYIVAAVVVMLLPFLALLKYHDFSTQDAFSYAAFCALFDSFKKLFIRI